jgi:acetolactate synthase-1/3 small subunit
MQPHIEREMALIDVAATPGAARQEVLSLVGVFRAKVVDISQAGMIIEASGNKEKVEALIELLRPLGIRDITRTGCIAIGRLSNIDLGASNEKDGLEFRVPAFESGTQNSELKT